MNEDFIVEASIPQMRSIKHRKAEDDVVPLDESERIVKGLGKQGVQEVKLTIYPEAKHDSWTETYNNPELYEWLATKSR